MLWGYICLCMVSARAVTSPAGRFSDAVREPAGSTDHGFRRAYLVLEIIGCM